MISEVNGNYSFYSSQIEEKIDDIKTVQTDLAISSDAAESTQEATVHHKSEKPKKSQANRLKLFEIYRFADKLDIFLMIIGTIAG